MSVVTSDVYTYETISLTIFGESTVSRSVENKRVKIFLHRHVYGGLIVNVGKNHIPPGRNTNGRRAARFTTIILQSRPVVVVCTIGGQVQRRTNGYRRRSSTFGQHRCRRTVRHC